MVVSVQYCSTCPCPMANSFSRICNSNVLASRGIVPSLLHHRGLEYFEQLRVVFFPSLQEKPTHKQTNGVIDCRPASPLPPEVLSPTEIPNVAGVRVSPERTSATASQHMPTEVNCPNFQLLRSTLVGIRCILTISGTQNLMIAFVSIVPSDTRLQRKISLRGL